MTICLRMSVLTCFMNFLKRSTIVSRAEEETPSKSAKVDIPTTNILGGVMPGGVRFPPQATYGVMQPPMYASAAFHCPSLVFAFLFFMYRKCDFCLYLLAIAWVEFIVLHSFFSTFLQMNDCIVFPWFNDIHL